MGIGPRHHDIARFNRLAQGFQNGSRKLGELVQEQHPVMGQTHLPRLGPLPPAHNRRHRGCVMRLAKRPSAVDPALAEQPRQRMDHRGFQRFPRRKLRQDPRHPCRQHRLARSRRADHQQMVPPCCGNFQGPLGAFLSLYIAQITPRWRSQHLARLRCGQGLPPCEMRHHLAQ